MALAEVLNNTGGLWFGWSGKIVDDAEGDDVHFLQAGPVKLAMVDLSQVDHDAFYLGYSNGVLWPVFHYRLDLADFDAGYISGYRRVNQLFAQAAAAACPDDVIWVHDYHLIAGGGTARTGLPAAHRLLPAHPAAAAADPGRDPRPRLADPRPVRLRPGRVPEQGGPASLRYVETEAHAQPLDDSRWRAFGRTVHAGAFPIGIDVEEFTGLANGRRRWRCTSA